MYMYSIEFYKCCDFFILYGCVKIIHIELFKGVFTVSYPSSRVVKAGCWFETSLRRHNKLVTVDAFLGYFTATVLTMVNSAASCMFFNILIFSCRSSDSHCFGAVVK